MALARCEKHFPTKQKFTYLPENVKTPVGYPNITPVICANRHCLQPGLLCLTLEEAEDYKKGERCFSSKSTRKSGFNALGGAAKILVN